MEVIKNQISSIKDPHFFFEREQRGNYSSSAEFPFRIGRHFKGFFITATSNSCPSDITVGMQVTHVDSVNLEVLYNSLGNAQTNIQSVINRMSGDTVTIKTVDGRSIVVTKQTGITYPSNYYKPLRDFKFIDGKYVYFSFKWWTLREYIYFTNKLKTIKSEEIDCFIFDLRNNPGGQEFIAYLTASMFVNQPRVFSNHSYYHEGNLIKESIVITPNKNFQFKEKKVVLLVNRVTACASEAFISVMKKYTDAIIIGQEGSAGAYAAVNNFYLPDGISFSANILNKIEFPDYQIDNKGILPDMYVYLYNPEDFFPHNDKILQRTLEYLRLTEDNTFCIY
jgi:C-terminal processing protease CtpA/Prc